MSSAQTKFPQVTPVTLWLVTLLTGASLACDAVNLYAVTEVSATTDQADATENGDNDSTELTPAPVDVTGSGDETDLGDETDSVDRPVDGTSEGPVDSSADSSADSAADSSADNSGESTDDTNSSAPSSQSPGCLAAALPAGDTDVAVQVDDTSRNYVLHVPEAYTGSDPVPLIVDFHGIGESGRSELSLSTYPEVTDPEGVIMAFPDGLNGPLGRAWNFGPCCLADVDDFAFARALVNDVAAKACINLDRVYAVGILTGGGMVQHLACEAADLFAAVAPESFDLLQETTDSCSPSRPITVLSRRATADARVPYEGGPSEVVPGMPITFLGAVGSLERWSQINDCTGPRAEEDEHGCTFYTDCADGVDVALCTNYGDGEAPAAANVAWPILKRHSR